MNVPKGAIELYGLLDIANGIEGYWAEGRLPWLDWNAGFGALALVGLLVARTRPRMGFAMSVAVAALDTVFFGLKLAKAPAVWPAGAIAVAAVVAMAASVFGWCKGPH